MRRRGAPITGSILPPGAVALAALCATAALAQTPTVPSTRDFVADAAHSDHFEVVEAQTAMTQTRDPRVRAFAQEMVQAHTGTSQALAQAAGGAGMATLPHGLSGDQARLLSALQGQRGPEFDRTYLKQQVLGHTEALVVEEAYAAQGADAGLRQAARSAVPVIQGHLQEAKSLRAALGGD